MATSTKHKERSCKSYKANEGMKAQTFHKAISRAELVRQSKVLKGGKK